MVLNLLGGFGYDSEQLPNCATHEQSDNCFAERQPQNASAGIVAPDRDASALLGVLEGILHIMRQRRWTCAHRSTRHGPSFLRLEGCNGATKLLRPAENGMNLGKLGSLAQCFGAIEAAEHRHGRRKFPWIIGDAPSSLQRGWHNNGFSYGLFESVHSRV